MGRRAHGEGTITQRGDGTWMGQISLGYDGEGKRKRKTVYGKTQKEVRAKLDEIKQQLASGTLSDTKLTVKQYLERWLKEKARSVKPRTVEIYKDWAERLVNPRLGSVRLGKLTPMQVQSMVSDIADKVGAPTANKVRKMLYGALKQAVRWQLVPRNVCEAVDPLKENPMRLTLWTSEHAVRFLSAARASRYYAAFYIIMVTGLRRGEVLGLEWGDLREDRLYIQRSYTMSNKGPVWSTPKTERGKRYVTLPADALDVLEEHRRRQEAERTFMGDSWPETDLIFTTEVGGPVSPSSFHTVWLRLQKEAEVPSARLHDLRHLHVSLLIKQGFDPRTVADRVGHSDPAFTLRRYSHMFEERRKAAAVNLADLLGADVPPDELN